MDLSIIIPVYNVELYIEKCINSVLNQSQNKIEYEVIIVDDGSPDDSIKIITPLVRDLSNVKIIRQKNKGVSEARNVGLRAAIGKYVWFIDSDDWIDSNSFITLEKLLKMDFDGIAIECTDVLGDRKVRRFNRVKKANQVMTGLAIIRHQLFSCVVTHTIYNKAFLLENKLYQMRGVYHEDTEFSPRAYHKAEQIYILNKSLYYVTQNPHSITRSFNPKKSFDLIKVAKSLDSFTRANVKTLDAVHYHRIISSALNSSLMNTVLMDKSDRDRYSKVFFENKYLLSHFFKSKKIKYLLEGFVLKLNSNNVLKSYDFLRKLTFKNK